MPNENFVYLIFSRWPYEENETFEGASSVLEIAKKFCEEKIKGLDIEFIWEDLETRSILKVNYAFQFTSFIVIKRIKLLEG